MQISTLGEVDKLGNNFGNIHVMVINVHVTLSHRLGLLRVMDF